MPKHILVAALGDYPAVITCAVQAFYAQGTPIHVVHLLYPNEREQMDALQKSIGEVGVQMIADYLAAHCPACTVLPAPLPFADAASVKASRVFLQRLRMLLDEYADEPDIQVHMLLAGGRKNMAALMALAAQFYPNVVGLYYLLDEAEDFASLELILAHAADAENRVKASLGRVEHTKLFALPYLPAPANRAALLREAIDSMNRGEPHDAVLPLSPAAALFYSAMLARTEQAGEGGKEDPIANAPPLGMEVWLSASAARQYRQWQQTGSPLAAECLKHLPAMADAAHLRRNRVADANLPSGADPQFAVYCPVGTTVRPVYVTTPDPLSKGAHGDHQQVVVCCFTLSIGAGEFEPPLSAVAAAPPDDRPSVRLAELQPQERVLIVPLGESPMVATQTCTLLRESEAEGKPQIALVALVFPEQNGQIQEQAALLQMLFGARGVQTLPFPVSGIKDLDSEAACRAYLDTLRATIAGLRRDKPRCRIDLSLSGGRKGMSALALLAAQLEGLDAVYHTLIADPELAKRIEKDTEWKTLQDLRLSGRKARRLFLDEYAEQRDKFVLFPIPVIPFAPSAPSVEP